MAEAPEMINGCLNMMGYRLMVARGEISPKSRVGTNAVLVSPDEYRQMLWGDETTSARIADEIAASKQAGRA